MDVKRIFRGWFVWLLVGLLGFFLVLSFVDSSGGYERVDTSTVLSAIEDGKVKSAKVLGRRSVPNTSRARAFRSRKSCRNAPAAVRSPRAGRPRTRVPASSRACSAPCCRSSSSPH
jgi:FtsH Extracellular